MAFKDTQQHWAAAFIDGLAERNIVRGFPDGTFRPNQSVTRAEFAVMLDTAFSLPTRRPYSPFKDVANHWAAKAIRRAYEMGFMSGFPDGTFRPNLPITRNEALIALVSGLTFPAATVPLETLYQDSAQIPGWAVNPVMAATAAEIVVNYPNVKRLRPQESIARSEVSAFLYQCLVKVGRAPALVSGYIVRWQSPGITVSHTREFRAAWIASAWNQDFPSRQGLTTQQQQAELVALFDRLQKVNFNAVIFQVRPEGDALYASQLEPWSHLLTGTQGKAPDPAYDPLQFAINQAHDRGMELHAWFNPYRARTSRNTVNVRPHLAVTNPDVVYTYGSQLWMDPGARVVQDRTYAVILDVVRRYDVDGIHLDDYFYPYPIAGTPFPDSKTYQAYQAGGGKLSLADWRRDNVNRLIQRLAAGIRAEKGHVKFGISPFGIYRPGQPPGIQGLDSYEQLYADALKWLREGWIDYMAPQLYWRIDPPAQSFTTLLDWWTSNNGKQRHIYAGTSLEKLNGNPWGLSETERQIAITRQRRSQLALGNIFYSLSVIQENRLNVGDRFETATYQAPALAPTMPWLGGTTPAPPTGVRVLAGKLTWNAAPPDVRAWTLYRQQGAGWTLQQILPAATTAVPIPPGQYALCAVNRYLQESSGIVVKV